MATDAARAMLDALMGGDRNAAIPAGSAVPVARGGRGRSGKSRSGGGGGGGGQAGGGGSVGGGPALPGHRRRSCYDRDVCPLYCAWGVDVHDLFTNTKSDLGPNPYVVDDNAREEYLSLPDHEKDRLGYERMLHDKLRELVRGCDRIVSRNREKLRAELARQQRARGAKAKTEGDPATSVNEEQLLGCSENMALVELMEEEIDALVNELESIVRDEDELTKKLEKKKESDRGDPTAGEGAEEGKDGDGAEKEGDNMDVDKKEGEPEKDADSQKDSKADAKTNEKNGEKKDDKTSSSVEEKKEDSTSERDSDGKTLEKQDGDDKESSFSKLKELQLKKQFVLTRLSALIAERIPPRDLADGAKRQLYHYRSDTTSDKTVCDVSGNFMSSRDADERIAAHYAGKQYVGWKMVRDKNKELGKKYGGAGVPGGPPLGSRGGPMGGGPPMGGGRGGPPPPGYGHGPPPHGYGGGGGGPPHGGGYGHGPPPPGYGGPPPGYGGGGSWGAGGGDRGGDRHRRDRSRSRDHDSRGGGGKDRGRTGSGRRGGGRSPSPPYWERDRGGSGGGSRGYGGDRDRGRRGGSGSGSGRDRDRRR
uniref:Uncharacterized protein n=1 Tax=Odontella aurita TaxID=265563 RepID=A0A6U6KSJ8_9STRA|mmetsp:Transcript_62261/g.184166  ORF Transcript_62261/g.184166 Transcript_62261/m.184166 type:complete len:590 (+) Transcript_62261:105-1874(+)